MIIFIVEYSIDYLFHCLVFNITWDGEKSSSQLCRAEAMSQISCFFPTTSASQRDSDCSFIKQRKVTHSHIWETRSLWLVGIFLYKWLKVLIIYRNCCLISVSALVLFELYLKHWISLRFMLSTGHCWPTTIPVLAPRMNSCGRRAFT